MSFLSFDTIVALLSYTEGQLLPTISAETNSCEAEYFICSIESPYIAAFLIMSLRSSTEVSFFTVRLRIARDALGVGTLTAFAVNLPSKLGIAYTTALPAPVSVITIFRGADLPLLYFLW